MKRFFDRALLALIAFLPLNRGMALDAVELHEPQEDARQESTFERALFLKNKLFEPFASRTTLEMARQRLGMVENLSTPLEVDAKFNLLVQELIEKGLIEIDENDVVSGVSSFV